MESTMKIIGSPEQEAFWDEIVNGKSHLILQARAGTGKTFSCIEGSKRLLESQVPGAEMPSNLMVIEEAAVERYRAYIG